ncbi:D-lyxose/D-mannose family sugar isomerase [Pelagibius sp. Alg239-R121]|uniref:D-lyxose/D-mannose family sugar isomerase n=1 Tax=Pelagibius sp. Alg239-R121 TaxID=2993448 RepID=UPI0024A6CCBA|nr:D-lyxose/D-mannose family sugar isomerase [Pelagibius sp. Alg239-R121]
MKRSEINEIVRQGQSFIESFGFVLPPFAHWSVDEWAARTESCREIFRAGLGWDITDYGLGDYGKTGLFLFTVRNGRQEDLSAGKGMLYAEKIMISKKDQLAPMHYHEAKAEDIINRGGGDLAVKLYHSNDDGELDRERKVTVYTDGVERTFAPGDILRLKPGESVTLLPRVYHAFWGEKDDVLVGEVSTVNDDHVDNYFLNPIGRFPEIEEDELKHRLLVGDYEALQ